MRAAGLLLAALALVVPAGAQTPAEAEVRAGVCRYARGDAAGARRHFERAAALEPSAGHLLLVARVAGDAAAFERVLERDPNNEEAHLSIAELFYRRGDTAGARAYVRARGASESIPRATRARLYQAAFVHELHAANELRQQRSKPLSPGDVDLLRGHVRAALDDADRIVALEGASGHFFRRLALENAAALAEIEGKPATRDVLRMQAEAAGRAHAEAAPAPEPERYEDEVIHEQLLASGSLDRPLGPFDVVRAVTFPLEAPPPPEPLAAEQRKRRPFATFVRAGEFSVSMPAPVASDAERHTAWSEGVEYSVAAISGDDDPRATAARNAMEEYEQHASTRITVGRAEAEVRFESPCGDVRVVRIRVVRGNGRAYMLRVTGAAPGDPQASAFLDSFKLLP